MQYKRKDLLSTSVVKKRSRIDPEKILFDNLYPKFGERFSNYREKYDQYLNNENYEHNFDYPISVILELVNRCNLECTMCYQGYRNDTEKYTLNEDDLKKIFDDFKINKLDALLLSASEPLLYNKINRVLELARKSEIKNIFIFQHPIAAMKKNLVIYTIDQLKF